MAALRPVEAAEREAFVLAHVTKIARTILLLDDAIELALDHPDLGSIARYVTQCLAAA